MSNPIIVVETIQAKPGQTQALKQALLEITPLCRQEPGCISYEIAEPLNDSGNFLVLMRWESEQAYAGHETAAHITEFVEKYQDTLLGDYSENVWQLSII